MPWKTVLQSDDTKIQVLRLLFLALPYVATFINHLRISRNTRHIRRQHHDTGDTYHS